MKKIILFIVAVLFLGNFPFAQESADVASEVVDVAPVESENVNVEAVPETQEIGEPTAEAKIEAEVGAETKPETAAVAEDGVAEELFKEDVFEAVDQKKNWEELFEIAKEKAEIAKKNLPEHSSPFEQIRKIEEKKKSFVDIRKSNDALVAESDLKLQQEAQSKIAGIERMPYKDSELKNGEPTKAAKAKRDAQIENVKSEYEQKMLSAENEIRNATKKQETSIAAEIYADFKAIARTITVTSFEDEMKFSIGDYNETSHSWPVGINVSFDGVSFLEQQVELKYSDLTGVKKIPTEGKEHDDYLENVDFYNTAFKRNVPILIFEVDYRVVPKSDDFPSQYVFNFDKIKIKNTIKSELISSSVPTQKEVLQTMEPVYDIRVLDSKKLASSSGKSKKTPDEKQYEKTSRHDAYIKKGMGGLRFGASFNDTGFFGAEGNFNVSLGGHAFIGAAIGVIKTPSEIQADLKHDFMPKFEGVVGFNLSPRIFHYPPNIYFMGKAAGVLGFSSDEWKKANDDDKNTQAYLMVGGAAGIEIPIVRHLAFFGQFDVNYIFDAGLILSGQAGLNIRFGK